MRLRMKQNVPPKPETIFAGLSSRRLAVEPELKLGNRAPMPTAMPHNAKLITTTVEANSNVSQPGIWSIQLDVSMRTRVMAAVQTLLSQNFSSSTRFNPYGTIPIIHNRLPSKLNWGNTKRVVSVASVMLEAPRLRKETKLAQRSVSRG